MAGVPMNGPISVEDILNEHIASIEEPREPDGKWHPSSYWGCTRRAIYEVRGTTPTNPSDARALRVFRVGHLLHGFLQSALQTVPDFAEFYPEFEIESKLEERGHGDGLIYLQDGTVIVLEIKSIKSTGFRYVKLGPKEDHAKQASSYAVAARNHGVWVEDPKAEGGRRFIEALGEKLIGIHFVYLDKDSLSIQEHWQPYDPAWEERVAERIAELNRYRDDPDSLPPRLPMTKKNGKLKKNWMCDWGTGRCPFLDKCWKQDPAKVEPGADKEVVEVYEW